MSSWEKLWKNTSTVLTYTLTFLWQCLRSGVFAAFGVNTRIAYNTYFSFSSFHLKLINLFRSDSSWTLHSGVWRSMSPFRCRVFWPWRCHDAGPAADKPLGPNCFPLLWRLMQGKPEVNYNPEQTARRQVNRKPLLPECNSRLMEVEAGGLRPRGDGSGGSIQPADSQRRSITLKPSWTTRRLWAEGKIFISADRRDNALYLTAPRVCVQRRDEGGRACLPSIALQPAASTAQLTDGHKPSAAVRAHKEPRFCSGRERFKRLVF